MIDDNGELVTEKEGIAEVFATFYERLYQARFEDNRPSRSSPTIELKPASADELLEAVRKLKRGKSPDEEGIIAEMLKDGSQALRGTVRRFRNPTTPCTSCSATDPTLCSGIGLDCSGCSGRWGAGAARRLPPPLSPRGRRSRDRAPANGGNSGSRSRVLLIFQVIPVFRGHLACSAVGLTARSGSRPPDRRCGPDGMLAGCLRVAWARGRPSGLLTEAVASVLVLSPGAV